MLFRKITLVLLVCLLNVGFLNVPFFEKKKQQTTMQSVRKLIERKEFSQALVDFKKLTPDAQNDDYRFLNFFLLFVNEKYGDVAKLSTKGLENYVLADYLLLYAATSLNKIKQYDKAAEVLEAQPRAFYGSRLLDMMASERITSSIELKRLDEAGEYLKRWGNSKLDRDERVEKLFLEGRLLETSGRLAEAVATYKRIYIYYPLTSSSDDAEARLKKLKSLDFTRSEMITRVKKVIGNGYLYTAKQELNTLKKYYFQKNDRELLYYIAKLYLKIGKKAKAKQNLELFTKYAEEERGRNSQLDALLPEAKYELIVREWNDGHDRDCRELRGWLVKHYPNNKWTAKATWILGKMSENKDDFPAAIEYYQEYLRYDGADDETYWRLGWVYYLSGKFEQSAENFQKSRQFVKDAYLEQQILFWLGMALLKNDRKEEATSVFSALLGKYKNTYYGFLATTEAAKHKMTLTPKPYKTRPLNFDGSPVLKNGQKITLDKINKLNELGLHHLAAKEVDFLDENTSNGKVGTLYLSNLYKESKAYYQSHSILLKALISRGIYNYDELPKEFLETLLPKYYFDFITAAGERHKVSPYFVLSLIKQESSFNPEALSSAGAVGLMQLMPATAKRTFQKQALYKHIDKDGFHELENPGNNIEIGIAHIKELAGQMNNSPVEVIASYNAGKNAVASWLKRFDKSDLPVFIERITYPETRNYVKKVATNIFNYESIYGKQSMGDGVFGDPETIFER